MIQNHFTFKRILKTVACSSLFLNDINQAEAMLSTIQNFLGISSSDSNTNTNSNSNMEVESEEEKSDPFEGERGLEDEPGLEDDESNDDCDESGDYLMGQSRFTHDSPVPSESSVNNSPQLQSPDNTNGNADMADSNKSDIPGYEYDSYSDISEASESESSDDGTCKAPKGPRGSGAKGPKGPKMPGANAGAQRPNQNQRMMIQNGGPGQGQGVGNSNTNSNGSTSSSGFAMQPGSAPGPNQGGENMDFDQMMGLLNSGHGINMSADIAANGEVTEKRTTVSKAEPGQTVTTYSDGRVEVVDNNNCQSGGPGANNNSYGPTASTSEAHSTRAASRSNPTSANNSPTARGSGSGSQANVVSDPMPSNNFQLASQAPPPEYQPQTQSVIFSAGTNPMTGQQHAFAAHYVDGVAVDVRHRTFEPEVEPSPNGNQANNIERLTSI